MDIYVTYNSDDTKKKLGDSLIKESPFFIFMDERTRKGKRDAWKLKSQFAARETPFIAVYKNGNPIKAFYSEASSDIINDLISYLNE